ncbi:MAG: hypothetical protein IK118_09865, partial [Clostridia bacterium]|nr:hypothetical protein [Clostridia bacterium]
ARYPIPDPRYPRKTNLDKSAFKHKISQISRLFGGFSLSKKLFFDNLTDCRESEQKSAFSARSCTKVPRVAENTDNLQLLC